jgi:hypothetical protein
MSLLSLSRRWKEPYGLLSSSSHMLAERARCGGYWVAGSGGLSKCLADRVIEQSNVVWYGGL